MSEGSSCWVLFWCVFRVCAWVFVYFILAITLFAYFRGQRHLEGCFRNTNIHTYVQYIFIFIIFCSFIFIPSHHDWCWRIVDTGIFFFTVVVFSYVVVVICFDFFLALFSGGIKCFDENEIITRIRTKKK